MTVGPMTYSHNTDVVVVIIIAAVVVVVVVVIITDTRHRKKSVGLRNPELGTSFSVLWPQRGSWIQGKLR